MEKRSAGGARAFLQSSAIVFVCYTAYGILQEFILKRIPGYEFGTFLTLYQFVASIVVLHRWRAIQRRPAAPGARPPLDLATIPRASIGFIALLSALTVCLSNVSVGYLNYPTQVLLKNGKLIPIMLVGRVWLAKRYTPLHYASVVLLTVGLALFSVGDALTDVHISPVGVGLVACALAADAFIGNAQERLLLRHPRLAVPDLMLYTKLFAACLLFVATAIIGELPAAIAFCIEQPSTLVYLTLYSLSGCVGEVAVLALVHEFGALEAATVTSLRKMCTLLLSFVLFPKPFALMHAAGACTTGAALGLNLYCKNGDECLRIARRCCRRRRRPAIGLGAYDVV